MIIMLGAPIIHQSIDPTYHFWVLPTHPLVEFPRDSLNNTEDWFFSWPQQALLAVAEHFLANVTGIDDFRTDKSWQRPSADGADVDCLRANLRKCDFLYKWKENEIKIPWA